MPYQTNQHVNRLGSYLVFNSGHSQVYEEQGDPNLLRSLPTAAFRTLEHLVQDRAKRLIILTGDAGHGKTHLCRRLLESALDLETTDAHRLINEDCDGRNVLGRVADRDLKIIKDLSDHPELAATELIESALADSGSVTIVCANEGKLRNVASSSERLRQIIVAMESNYQDGDSDVDQGISVIDLNFQSVTSDEEGGLLGDLLKQWVDDGRKWGACTNCTARDHCPIYWNRSKLAVQGENGLQTKRAEGLRTLLRIVEQTGHIITIRELLILVAFLITGNSGCAEIAKKHQRSRDDTSWQYRYLFFQSLFEPPLNQDQARSLPLLGVLSRFDPGRNAIRRVDDVLAADTDLPEMPFVPPELRASIFTPRSRQQARNEGAKHRSRISFLRRRDFFELETDRVRRDVLGRDDPVSQAERVGFRHYDAFVFMCGDQDDTVAVQRRLAIRNRVLKGLEAVQDLRRSSTQTGKFAVVDPAYGNSYGSASILAKMIIAKHISIKSRKRYWTERRGGEEPTVCSEIDWIDRRIVVAFAKEEVTIELDLLGFEFVMRSAEGLSCRRFFMGEIRRIMMRLAALCESGDEGSEEIRVVFGNHLRSLTIDEGSKIVCEDG